jgi:hypothetical protein
MKYFIYLAFLVCLSSASPLQGPGRINDLPGLDPYQPEKAPNVPIVLGERRK